MILIESASTSYPFFMLMEAKIRELTSKKSYDKALAQLKPTSRIKEGFFYSYDYAFDINGPEDIVDYYDKNPLIICLKVKSATHFYGWNVHHIPVLTRANIISRIEKLYPQSFKRDGYFKVPISANVIKSFARKSSYGFRLYRTDRVSDLKMVPNIRFRELSQYSPNTYYKVNIDQAMEKYRNPP